MSKHEARQKGLRLAARITGIGGIVIAATALAEARVSAATTEPTDEAAEEAAKEALKVEPRSGGGCGCSPCWGPPAPPAEGSMGLGSASWA